MQLTYTIHDVFTTTRYTGNPLAIVTVPSNISLTKVQKQRIAQEFNLSETVFMHNAFICDQGDLPIEIFTPQAELPFAGHPTIGTAHYVLRQGGGGIYGLPAGLRTKAGRIPIMKWSGESSAVVRARIPHNVHIHSMEIESGLSKTGVCPIVSIVKGMNFILVPVQDLDTLSTMNAGIRRDPYEPEDLDPGWAKGLTGTYFYVAQGIDEEGQQAIRTRMHLSEEDAATGSAASALSCYLALKEPMEKGKGPFKFAITQGVEMGRKSEIMVEILRNEKGDGIMQVLLGGSAVRVMEGKIEVDE